MNPAEELRDLLSYLGYGGAAIAVIIVTFCYLKARISQNHLTKPRQLF